MQKNQMKMNENGEKMLSVLIEQANKNMKAGFSIGKKISIEDIQLLCGYGPLDGDWIASGTGQFCSGNNTFLYNINGANDLFAMFTISMWINGDATNGVCLYGTIHDLFFGLCYELATIATPMNCLKNK